MINNRENKNQLRKIQKTMEMIPQTRTVYFNGIVKRKKEMKNANFENSL